MLAADATWVLVARECKTICILVCDLGLWISVIGFDIGGEVTSHRDAAWQAYAESLANVHVTGESLENAEIDFKAGFDAAQALELARNRFRSWDR
ncbi:hypothetical protein ACH3VR_23275 [Microbacterium sp. B2969]|uniref:Uncharacterized protein n=1 Tax=Microbacterium alkaliflavum TaxID=3248839 RepID=A0ABW7QEX4_9MICO